MGKPIKISLDLTQLGELAKAGHSAIKRAGKKNHVYVNLDVWVNDRTDTYGNDVSITVGSTKAGRDAGEAKVYVGNGKTGNQNNSASGWGQQNQATQQNTGWENPPPSSQAKSGPAPWGGDESDGLPF